MFNVGPVELMIILIIALLVLGPKKLPEAARQVGKALSEFRRVSSGLQDEVRAFTEEAMAETPGPASLPPSDVPIAPPPDFVRDESPTGPPSLAESDGGASEPAAESPPTPT